MVVVAVVGGFVKWEKALFPPGRMIPHPRHQCQRADTRCGAAERCFLCRLRRARLFKKKKHAAGEQGGVFPPQPSSINKNHSSGPKCCLFQPPPPYIPHRFPSSSLFTLRTGPVTQLDKGSVLALLL